MHAVTDLEAAVDQLHAVPLEDFVAERKRLAKELRGAGEREAAAELAKLPEADAARVGAQPARARAAGAVSASGSTRRRPCATRSAHADQSSGDAVRAAMAAHRDATRALLAAVRDKTRPNGRELSEPMLDRVRDLLRRRDRRPGAGERLRAGRSSRAADDGGASCRGRARAGRRARVARRAAPAKRAARRGARDAGRPPGRRAARGRGARGRRARRPPSARELERLVAEAEERLGELREAAEERAPPPPRPRSGSRRRAARCTARSPRRPPRARPPRRRADAAEQAERELRS